MNDFITQQQGEYGEWDIEVDGVKYAGGRTIQNVITNTGEELLRLVETKHTREMQLGENRAKYLAFQRGEEHMRHKIIDTLKKHITSLTGVEEIKSDND